MPKDNIERAIDKSSVNTESNFESLRYEGFGPEKVAVIVETLTDNKNRTASNIRTIFQKAGGNLGTQGSASHNFNQLGVIKIDKNEVSDERILELAIDAGADECKTDDNFHEIQCSLNEIYNVKKLLEKNIDNFISTEIEWIPLNRVEVSKEKNDKSFGNVQILFENTTRLSLVPEIVVSGIRAGSPAAGREPPPSWPCRSAAPPVGAGGDTAASESRPRWR